MLFAEMDNQSIAVIGAIVMVLLKLLEKIYDDWRLDRAARKVSEEAKASAERVKAVTVAAAIEVKQALAIVDANKTAHLNAQDKAISSLAEDMSTVKTQTNGLLNQVKQDAFNEGIREGSKKS